MRLFLNNYNFKNVVVWNALKFVKIISMTTILNNK